MKCFKKIIFTLSYFLLLMNIITLKAGKNHKIKLGNANKHKIRGTQPPYMTVTVDPYKVEADDVGFRRIDVPVMRRSNIHSGVVDGMLDPSHTFQSPNNIHTAQGINLHQRQYLPYSNYYDPTHVMHDTLAGVSNHIPNVSHIGISSTSAATLGIQPVIQHIPLHDDYDIHNNPSSIMMDDLDGRDMMSMNNLPIKRDKKNILSLHPKKKILNLDRRHPVNNFFQWASNSGIRMKKLLVFEEKNTGKSSIKTGEEIGANEKILEVPNDQLIFPYSKYLSKLCNDISNINVSTRNANEFISNTNQICMAIYILSKDAQLNPFINFLFSNTNFQSFPFFFNIEESDMLKGSFFRNLVDVKRHSIYTEYKLLQSAKFIPEEVSKKDYLKARVIIMANSLKISNPLNGEETEALIPVAGLFEHGTRRNGSLKMNKVNNVEVIAERRINKNDKIVLSVGSYNNYQNLLYFGYTKKNREKKPIEIALNVDLPYNIDSSTNNEVILTSEANINKNLKIFRRIAYSTLKKNKKRTYFSTPIDLDNEILALKLYKRSLQELLNNYESTLQQDIDNYKTNENENITNILRILIEEKKIIMRHFNAVLIFMKILKNEYANVVDINHPIIGGDHIHEVNLIHSVPISPAHSDVNFLQMNDLYQSVILPEKQSIFILNKINLKKYFDLIKKIFNLNYELNPGNDYSYQDHLLLGEDDDDISDFQDLLVLDNTGNYVENVVLTQAISEPPTLQVDHLTPYQSNPIISSQYFYAAQQHDLPTQHTASYSTQNMQTYPTNRQETIRPTPQHRIEPGLIEDVKNEVKINTHNENINYNNNSPNQMSMSYDNAPGNSVDSSTENKNYKTAKLRTNSIEAEENTGGESSNRIHNLN